MQAGELYIYSTIESLECRSICAGNMTFGVLASMSGARAYATLRLTGNGQAADLPIPSFKGVRGNSTLGGRMMSCAGSPAYTPDANYPFNKGQPKPIDICLVVAHVSTGYRIQCGRAGATEST